MRATKPSEAKKEGQRFGRLLSKIFEKRLDVRFEDASDLAQYVAIELLQYRDAEIANAYTAGFIAAITETQTPEELKEQYSLGLLSTEELGRAISRALKNPRAEDEE